MRSAGIELKIGLFGEAEVSGQLLNSVRRINDASPWFRMMHGWLEKQMESQFDTQGGHLSGGWKPLADSTLAMKTMMGIDTRILRGETGDLMRSLTGGGGDSIRFTSAKTMVFGSTVDYGKYHQSKKPRKQRKEGGDILPRRPILDLSVRAEKRRIIRSLGIFVARDRLIEPSGMFGGTGAGGGWQRG